MIGQDVLDRIDGAKRPRLAKLLAAHTRDNCSIYAAVGYCPEAPKDDIGQPLTILIKTPMSDCLHYVTSSAIQEREHMEHRILSDYEAEIYGVTIPAAAAKEPTYNPATQYVCNKSDNAGRPKRRLSDAEQREIDRRRAAGQTINRIAHDLHISNRVVSRYISRPIII